MIFPLTSGIAPRKGEAMHHKALIFDCDGTLMDSLGNALESFHYALEQMGEPRSTPEITRHFRLAADRILLNLLRDEDRARQAYQHYKEHQTLLAPQTKIYPGVMELLERAHQAAVPMGVVTGRHRQDLEILLKPHDLLPYFTVIVTDNELSEPKPSPEGLLKALAQFGLPGPQAFYIGDSLSDMQAAHAAGIKSVAALWDSKVERQKLVDIKPYGLAEQPDDVWTLFQSF
jgi:HAD superfamily hydrolase (TIGR01549 family)